MGLCGTIGFACYMTYALEGQKVVGLFSRAMVGKYANKVIGGPFIGSGIGLAASNRGVRLGKHHLIWPPAAFGLHEENWPTFIVNHGRRP